MPKKKAEPLNETIRVFALGGLDEDGKNLTCIEIDGDIYILECGIKFPDSRELLGIEYIVQDFTYLVEHQDSIKGIIITHGHDDHIGSVNELKRKYGILVYIMKEEEEFAESVQYNLSMSFGHPRVIEPDMFFIDGQEVSVLGTKMRALLTPGHTVGGGCYYFPEEKMVFTGDTLFCESVGRSDFPGGNARVLINSVREKLMTLPDDVVVYPGHGPATTIGYEKRANPFV